MTIPTTEKIQLNSLTFTEGKTQLPMKSNQGCCYFVKATDDNKLKQNMQAILAGRPPEGPRKALSIIGIFPMFR